MVQLMGRTYVVESGAVVVLGPEGGISSEEDVAQGLCAEVVFGLHGQVACHGGMKRGESVGLKHVVQGGDVAEADEPLRVLAEAAEVEFVHQVHGSVSAAAAEDDFGRLVVHRFLQVVEPLLYGAGIGAVRAACMAGHDHFQPPGFEPFPGSFQEGLVYFARGGEDDYAVALVQIGWENKAVHIFFVYFSAKVHNFATGQTRWG